MTGRLVLAGVPIGQVGDASERLRAAFGSADVVAAEDTRRLARLLRDLGVDRPARVVSYFEGNERARTPELIAELAGGAEVLLVTDAGMPSVSDPGYRLVAAAVGAGVPVTALPGPSAVTTALAVSGLPSDRFCFEGFPPRKSGARQAAYTALADERRTLIFFESPRRLADSLVDLAAAFGAGRAAVVCRELTKTHEEIVRGTLGELAAWAAGEVLGEITVVVGGSPAPAGRTPAQLAALVAEHEAAGTPRKEAIAAVVTETGERRGVVYDAVLAHKAAGRAGAAVLAEKSVRAEKPGEAPN